mgnify:FL=1
MSIQNLWGVRFHAVVVFGLGKNLLFKSILEHTVLKCKAYPMFLPRLGLLTEHVDHGKELGI